MHYHSRLQAAYTTIPVKLFTFNNDGRLKERIKAGHIFGALCVAPDTL